MKNLLLVLNIVLLLAVAWLYVDRYTGEDDAAGEVAEMDGEEPDGGPLRIMYLNIDTLHEKSEAFQAKREEMDKKQVEAENSMRSKLKSFESEVMAFQKKLQSGTMTPKSAEEEQTRLAQKEQRLAAEQERLGRELLQETDAFNVDFNMKVRGFLDSLKKVHNYDYILVAGAGSPILTAEEDYDLTKSVVEYLNRQEKE